MPRSSADRRGGDRRLSDWLVRRAGANDAPALAAVALATFLETFAGVLTGPDILAHCAANSSVAKFAAWASASKCSAVIAEHANGAAPLGYALVTPPDLPVATGEGDLELRRIYALSVTRGTGLGAALLAAAIADARAMGAGCLWLGVLATNRAARAFYERQGFALAGERRFLVGQTWHDDVVYARDV